MDVLIEEVVDLEFRFRFFDILGYGVVKFFCKGSSGKKSSPQVLLGRVLILMLC